MHTLLAGTQQHLGVRFGVVQPDVEWGSSGALIERGEELVGEGIVNTVTGDRYDKALYAMLLYIFQKLYLLNRHAEHATPLITLLALGGDAHGIAVFQHAAPTGPFFIEQTKLTGAVVVFYVDNGKRLVGL